MKTLSAAQRLILATLRAHSLPVAIKVMNARMATGEAAIPITAWLAEAESALNPAARSPVGAKGLFQFMPDTAKAMGLGTFLPDERTDPEKSARAAARYLKTLHGQFGSWPLAFAAYNAGEGTVQRAIDHNLKKGLPTDYASLPLPEETKNYVEANFPGAKVRYGDTDSVMVIFEVGAESGLERGRKRRTILGGRA